MLVLNSVDDSQGAAADAEAKSEELGRAVDELHKLLKEAGEGKPLSWSETCMLTAMSTI